MYQVIKVLNNNGILAIDQESGIEYIFMGKGIGFHNKEKTEFSSLEGVKKYKLEGEANTVDPMYFDIANAIMLEAEAKFGEIDTRIMLALADHISFAIERTKNGLSIANPFTNDIKVLFLEEYEVALKARAIIKDYTGILVNDDEVGYITLHIHSALTKEHVSRAMNVMMLVSAMTKEMESTFHIKINRESLSYTRLITHIKYMITRVLKKEALKVDMSPYVRAEFPESYQVASKLCKKLEKELGTTFSEIEIGYLAIHIERIRV